MIPLRPPMDSKLLTVEDITGKNRHFLAPFKDFLKSDTPLCRAVLLPENGTLRAPLSGILALCEPQSLCFAVCGRAQVLLCLHTKNDAALPLLHGDFLPLASIGAPLKAGQLLGWLDLAALRRRGCDVLLSLVTEAPPSNLAERMQDRAKE